MSDLRTLQTRLGSAFGQDLSLASTYNPGASGELAQLYQGAIYASFSKTAADGAAGTTTAATGFFWNPFPFPLQIIEATYVSQAGTITADNTNFATFNILTDNGAGGAPVVGVTRSTTIVAPGTGNIAAAVQSNLMSGTLTSAARVLPVGGGLWLSIGKSGTGVVVPIGLFHVALAKY